MIKKIFTVIPIFVFCFANANEFKKPVLSNDNVGVIFLNGDVNVTKNFMSIKDNGVQLPRLTTSGLQTQSLIWELESNLYIHYIYRRSYMEVNLRSDMDMGTQGGNVKDIELRRAFIGYTAVNAPKVHIDLMFGRQVASDLFDSKVMFYNLTLLNGLFINNHFPLAKHFDMGLKFAGLIFNFADRHYAYIVELNINELTKKGPYFKYTFTNWRKKGFSTIFNLQGSSTNNAGISYGKVRDNPRYRFEISQFILGYLLTWRGLPIEMSHGFLINHAAKRFVIFNNKKRNIAWYFDLLIGKADKKNHYAFEIIYQNVGAQALPGWDMSGIGTGNPRSNLIYGPAVDDFTGIDVIPTNATANGNVNFKGIELNYKYAITNNIQLELEFDYSMNQDKGIGPLRRFQNFKIAMHYNW
jgi:hypothetical protein